MLMRSRKNCSTNWRKLKIRPTGMIWCMKSWKNVLCIWNEIGIGWNNVLLWKKRKSFFCTVPYVLSSEAKRLEEGFKDANSQVEVLKSKDFEVSGWDPTNENCTLTSPSLPVIIFPWTLCGYYILLFLSRITIVGVILSLLMHLCTLEWD